MQETLEIIGLALVNEILSPSSGFILRLVSSESVAHPAIGSNYFEKWYLRRSRSVGQFFSKRMAKARRRNGRPFDSNLASRRFLA